MDGQWQARECGRIRDQGMWPHWPVLPMKRWDDRRHQMEIGVLWGADLTRQRVRVFLVNIGDLHSGRVGQQLEGQRFEEFESVEAMVAAGWAGD